VHAFPRASIRCWAWPTNALMPLFKRKKTGDKKADDSDAFRGDGELLQLHAETAALLRLVKTPAVQRSPLKRAAAVRQTMEVLEDDEEEEDGASIADTTAPAETPSNPAAEGTTDPFAFDAEEARVRRTSDVFVPHTSPSKRDVEQQRRHLETERERLARLEKRTDTVAARRVFEAENRPVINRIEASAIAVLYNEWAHERDDADVLLLALDSGSFQRLPRTQACRRGEEGLWSGSVPIISPSLTGCDHTPIRNKRKPPNATGYGARPRAGTKSGTLLVMKCGSITRSRARASGSGPQRWRRCRVFSRLLPLPPPM
jgi:hypothetical protein